MTVGVIGLGYVGLPLAVAFAEAGEDVVAAGGCPVCRGTSVTTVPV